VDIWLRIFCVPVALVGKYFRSLMLFSLLHYIVEECSLASGRDLEDFPVLDVFTLFVTVKLPWDLVTLKTHLLISDR